MLHFNKVIWGMLCIQHRFGGQEIKQKSVSVLVCAPSSQRLAFLQNCFHAKGTSGNFAGHRQQTQCPWAFPAVLGKLISRRHVLRFYEGMPAASDTGDGNAVFYVS